jgi:hypothetical protein
MSKTIRLILILQMLFFISCKNECLFTGGRSEYNELHQIPITKKAERIKKMESYSTEKQIDIYLFASKCERNPSIQDIFRDVGQSKIKPIVERIQTTKNEEDKYYLIQALFHSNAECHCIDQTSIEHLANAKSEINTLDTPSISFFKESYKSYLDNIISQTKQ